MSVLLLRLVGPMQSWGVQSNFGVRDTGLEPSKSGVLGLLCAALGRPRGADIADLAALQMAVRVDREGKMSRDFHTAGREGILKASGAVERRNLVVSTRYYLADARFLVGLEGDDPALLQTLHDALRDPHWLLYLGRKAFVPGEPVWLPDGLHVDAALLDALQDHPWRGRCRPQDRPPRLRLVVEAPDGTEVRPDQPVSFSERRFAPRRVRTAWITMEEERCTYLD
jgi:CRISPR system Cascade subunit CasD